MALEFMFVKYPSSRIVYIDDVRAGFTNTIMVVETGHHVIDLGKPKNYVPEHEEREVRDTSVIAPLSLEFDRVSG